MKSKILAAFAAFSLITTTASAAPILSGAILDSEPVAKAKVELVLPDPGAIYYTAGLEGGFMSLDGVGSGATFGTTASITYDTGSLVLPEVGATLATTPGSGLMATVHLGGNALVTDELSVSAYALAGALATEGNSKFVYGLGAKASYLMDDISVTFGGKIYPGVGSEVTAGINISF